MRKILEIVPLISWRFVLAAGFWAVCTTLVLDATGAPFWVFYLSPVTAIPLMLHELRAVDTRFREQKKKKPLVERVDQGHRAA